MAEAQRDGATPGLAVEAASFPGELYVKNAHKTFDVTKALDGCSFSAHFGEIHAIVGGNGCGKSTLAKVLSGVLPLDSGKVSVLGHHPSSPADARALGIATVFQEVLVADETSVVDNLYTGADGFWSRAKSARAKIAEASELLRELVGEEVDPLTQTGSLPLSVKAWITIARGLLSKPRVLILDESSAALDFDSTERLFAKMRSLRDEGVAILIVTHRIAELIRISDRATVMRDGRDVGVLEKTEITEHNLLGLMTGRSDSGQRANSVAHRTSSRDVMLRTRGLRVWPEADAVDFELVKGEIVGVTGLDGHGHDDFARILAGISPAASGSPEVRVNGAADFVEVSDLQDAGKHGIAFVSGDRKREGILPNLSIYENLLFPLYRSNARVPGARFIDWITLSDAFDWEVDRLSIKTGDRSDPITSLSGGNQQKVIIGRSLALHPRLLVLNDPARGIDVDTKRELYQQLREFAAEGNSVVYMSSELEEFIGFCSRVAVFRNGAIFDTFMDAEVEPVGILESMFGRARIRPSQDASGPRISGNDAITPAVGATAADGHASNGANPRGKPVADGIRHIKIREFDTRKADSRDPKTRMPKDKMKILFFD